MAGLRAAVTVCEAPGMHGGAPREERPAAAYLMYALPCEATTCDGRLICVGHAVCAPCAARIRADEAVWSDSGNDVDLVLIHGAGLQRAAS